MVGNKMQYKRNKAANQRYGKAVLMEKMVRPLVIMRRKVQILPIRVFAKPSSLDSSPAKPRLAATVSKNGLRKRHRPLAHSTPTSTRQMSPGKKAAGSRPFSRNRDHKQGQNRACQSWKV